MKAKLTKDVETLIGDIHKGVELNVKELSPGGYTFIVTDGYFKGVGLPAHALTFVTEEKTFTKKEVEAIEKVHLAKLEKERELKELSQQLVKNLTEKLKQKNAEIDHLKYFITSLTLSLKLSSEYVMKLRTQLQKVE